MFEQRLDVEDDQAREGQSVKHKVREIEVRRFGQVPGEQLRRLLRVIEDFRSHCRGARGEGGDEKHLHHLKTEVPILRREFDFSHGAGASESGKGWVDSLLALSICKMRLCPIHSLLQKTGTKAINRARRNAGKSPVIAPRINPGAASINPRNGTLSVR